MNEIVSHRVHRKLKVLKGMRGVICMGREIDLKPLF
jgi:hypothetical protein